MNASYYKHWKLDSYIWIAATATCPHLAKHLYNYIKFAHSLAIATHLTSHHCTIVISIAKTTVATSCIADLFVVAIAIQIAIASL